MAGAWHKQRSFAAKVRVRLSSHGWSVGDLAVNVEASPGYLHRVLRGIQEPTWSLAVRIAVCLGMSLDELADAT